MPDNFMSTSDTWMYHMRRGEFEEAWKFSDNILKLGINRDYQHLPRHFQCIWDGTTLAGKRVLIRCYHGLGDTIQFIRYASLVKEIASEVIVWAQPPLMELLKTVKGIDKLIPLHDGIPDAVYDTDVEIMELPHVFRTSLSSIPLTIPYLHVEPLRLPLPKGKLSIGLVWEAGTWNQDRNVPFSLLLPLFRIEGLVIYIMQANAVLAGWKEGYGYYPGEPDLLNYARIMKGLNLIISVDSMPAHLGGALGLSTWVMLHYGADWRWMEQRTDSPWYPSAKLFRQENKGDWKPVVEKVIREIKLWLAKSATKQ